MPKKKKPPAHCSQEPVYKQSQSPWLDPDVPVEQPGCPIPRPLTFQEMVFTPKIQKAPPFDMDSDLGA